MDPLATDPADPSDESSLVAFVGNGAAKVNYDESFKP